MRADHRQSKSYWDKVISEFLIKRGFARGFDASIWDKVKTPKEMKELVLDFQRQFGGEYDIKPDVGGTGFVVDGYYYTISRGRGKEYKAIFLHSVAPKK